MLVRVGLIIRCGYSMRSKKKKPQRKREWAAKKAQKGEGCSRRRGEEAGTKNEISNIYQYSRRGIQPVFAALSPTRSDARKRQKEAEKARRKKSSLGYPARRSRVGTRVYTRRIKSRALPLIVMSFSMNCAHRLLLEAKISSINRNFVLREFSIRNRQAIR